MARYIDHLNLTVRELVDDPSRTHNAFVSVAIAGEQLRRACEVEEPNADARATLVAYDRVLPTYATPSLDKLRRAVSEQLETFERYANAELRDPEAGEEILLRLEEAVSLGAAGLRANVFDASAVTSLAAGIADRVRRVADRCVELAELAERRLALFGPDPQLPTLYAWWEPLAELAPTRLALQSSVVAEVRRARRIEAALAAYDARTTQPGATDIATLARRPLCALIENLDRTELEPHTDENQRHALARSLRAVGRERGARIDEQLTRAFAEVPWLWSQVELARTPASLRGGNAVVEGDEPDDEALIELANRLAQAIDPS